MPIAAIRLKTLFAVATTAALRQLTVSSKAFDPEVVAGCSAAPLAPAFDDLLTPYVAPRCEVNFKWVELQRHANGTVDARVDIGGSGVSQGWAVEFDFNAQKLPMRALGVGSIAGAVELSTSAGVVVMRPRLASGLGTVLLSVRLPRSWPVGTAPLMRCVLEPGAAPADGGEAGGGDDDDDERWKESAKDDYTWMADEFNRQYINSHGKTHDDYQPDSPYSELQLHFLNGRLWCFFGAVHNATRSLREAVELDPEHLLSYLLLAKVHIGQGYWAHAQLALDEAARIQPAHWQTHMMRLFVLERQGKLMAPTARDSHGVVCRRLADACAAARMRDVLPLLCKDGVVQLTAESTGGTLGGGGEPPSLPSGARKTSWSELGGKTAAAATAAQGAVATAAAEAVEGAAVAAAAEDRGLYGHHLHSTEARRKLQLARYVTLRKILPPRLVKLLARWYAHLRGDVKENANFQGKTQRHEYFPEMLSTYLNFALVPFAARMSGQDVAPTYPFPITYVPGGGIHPHLDVSDNELSLTYQVKLEGADVWPLTFLDPRGQELSSLDASNASVVGLADNDGILYYGPDIVHWREPMAATLTQIVFAFREADPSHCNNQ